MPIIPVFYFLTKDVGAGMRIQYLMLSKRMEKASALGRVPEVDGEATGVDYRRGVEAIAVAEECNWN